MDDAEIDAYLEGYAPETAVLGRSLRAWLRGRLGGLSEVVYWYERQGAFVIAYAPGERGYEGVCSLSVRGDEVALYFPQGTALAASDPGGLLRGRGPGVRHVVIREASDLERPELDVLLERALALARVVPVPGARSAIVSRVASQQRRAAAPRRKGSAG